MENRELWLQQRKEGVGASDAAPILGMSPWKTALAVYQDKITDEIDDNPTEEMQIGLELEPTISRLYERRTGNELADPQRIVWSPDHNYMFATLDRVSKDGKRIVELKASGFSKGWGEEGTDDIPDHYLIQVHHQMACTDVDVVDVAVLIRGMRFRVYTVPRNEALIDEIVQREGEFWERVKSRTPPLPDWDHESTPRLLSRLYGVDEGKCIELGREARDAVMEYEIVSDQIRQMKKAQAMAKAKLLHMMGDAELAQVPGSILTRKVVKRKGYEVKPTQYMDFRVRGEKPASAP